ncbi:MAG: methyltransferase domain-containing protein [Deltaproteobacteria bacterium]|nr:methyltransferase domain-containing protein [Deltaproteobacteria bacterium]
MPLSEKERTRAQFGRVAAKYRCSADHTDVEDLDLLFMALALDPAHRVLDVATGGGHTAAAIAARSGRVVASDLTPSMLREARHLASERRAGNVLFAAADAEALPFREVAFDRVTCRIAPHHFPDVRSALSEMVRVTRPGGRIGIIDSTVPGDPSLDAFLNGVEKVRDPSHVRSYRIEEWLEFLAGAGLLLLQAASLWKTHAFPEWVARTGRPKAVQWEVERIFLSAFPLARETFRIRTDGGRVVSYSDEKSIFVAKKPEGDLAR